MPELIGLVLAGGQSRRMQGDKGSLEYHGMPQAEYCYRLLREVCDRVFVPVNRKQRDRHPYSGLPRLEDAGTVAGPAAGLLAAWAAYPDAALLALAVDLPLVDAPLLAELVGNRNPEKAATAWIHGDGVLEPLCAIWEPGLRIPLVESEATSARSPSLRRLLESADVERLYPPDPQRIVSVNTAEAYREMLRVLNR